MKPTISIALITLGLTLCPPAQAWPWGKYQSRTEASRACWEWAKENGFELNIQGRKRVESFSSVACVEEKETKQFLAQEVSRVMQFEALQRLGRKNPVPAADVGCKPSNESDNLDFFCSLFFQAADGEVLKRFRW